MENIQLVEKQTVNFKEITNTKIFFLDYFSGLHLESLAGRFLKVLEQPFLSSPPAASILPLAVGFYNYFSLMKDIISRMPVCLTVFYPAYMAVYDTKITESHSSL